MAALRPAALIAAAGAALLAGAVGLALAQSPKMRRVDLELVLAVDISRSMDYDEHALQRNGYVDAFRHKDVIKALTSGAEGKVAVTYMEWGAEARQVIPWTIIDSEKAALAFADRMAAEPILGERRTSISSALYMAADLIELNDIASHRRVIDVSGDGPNNFGLPVEEARDVVLKKSIVINGLPIILKQNSRGFGNGGFDIAHLDRYYKDCVIGGAGSFIAPVYDLKSLSATIRKKLVMEIAGIELDNGAAPVQFAEAPVEREGVILAQLKLPTTKMDCMIGEKSRGRGFGGGGFGFGPDG